MAFGNYLREPHRVSAKLRAISPRHSFQLLIEFGLHAWQFLCEELLPLFQEHVREMMLFRHEQVPQVSERSLRFRDGLAQVSDTSFGFLDRPAQRFSFLAMIVSNSSLNRRRPRSPAVRTKLRPDSRSSFSVPRPTGPNRARSPIFEPLLGADFVDTTGGPLNRFSRNCL